MLFNGQLKNNITSIIELICGMGNYSFLDKISIPYLDLNRENHSNFRVYEISKDNATIDEKFSLESIKEKSGLFSYHKLIKNGIDTPQALSRICHNFQIPNDWIGYAGLKDAQAITSQLISIWTPNGQPYPSFNDNSLALSEGVIRRYELNYGDLIGNYFEITLDYTSFSNDGELFSTLIDILKKINKFGFPNYYGTQRFGSIRPISHLVGKAILQKDWKSACIAYLGSFSNFEPEDVRNTRKEFSESLEIRGFLKKIPGNYFYERKIAKKLLHSNNYQRAIFSLSEQILTIFISSYQSFIYNWLLSCSLERSNQEDTFLQVLPIIGYDSDINKYPKWVKDELMYLLEQDNLSINSFNQKETWVRRKGSERDSFCLPNISFTNKQKQNFQLNFSLPKGSYATSLLREILQFESSNVNSSIFIANYKDYFKYLSNFVHVPNECSKLLPN
ncbi:MAG: tRNA pseudouridine(13) synthase TruD [Candidatus Thorarchaeota archaeon]